MILRQRSTLGNWAAGLLAAFAIGTPRIVTAQTTAAAAAKARADSTRYPYTAADIHFIQAMISHHAQAIVMSKWAATNGASKSILILSQRIINAQRDEIALMQRWLRDRLQQVPEPDTAGIVMTMTMAGMQHDMAMPGMLTETQLNQLEHARGAQFDRLFLRFMIQHHRGAVTMVRRLFDTYGAGQDQAIFKMASDINTDQNTEIARMQKMLLTLTLGR
jgi:uncharacterized protein (DUF305 family)